MNLQISMKNHEEYHLKQEQKGDMKKGGRKTMAILAGKKAIIIGDRDGIPGPAIAECVQSAGGEVIFSSRNALSEQVQAQWIWRIRSV